MKKIIKLLLVITITIIGFSAIAATKTHEPYNQVVMSLKQKYVEKLKQHRDNITIAKNTSLEFQNWITSPENVVVKAGDGTVTRFKSVIEEADIKVTDFEKFVNIAYIELDDLVRLKPHDDSYLICGQIQQVKNGVVLLNDKNGNYCVEIYCGDYPTKKFNNNNYLICQVKVIKDLNNLTCIALNTRGYLDFLNDTDWSSVNDSGLSLSNADRIYNRYYNKILPRVSALPCDEAVHQVIIKTEEVKKLMGRDPEPRCKKCGKATCNGSCTPLEPIKPEIPWEIIAAIVLIVLVIVVVVLIIALSRPKKPTPTYAPTCARCGSSPVYQDGLCVNCWNIKQHTCQKCRAYSHDIVDGMCPECRPPQVPCCPNCNTPLDENGVCPECTKVKCPQCGAIKVNGKCPNGCDTIKRCPRCNTPLDKNGVCPECTTRVRCSECGAIKVNGICPNGCKKDPLNLVWAEPEATRIYAKCALRVVGPEKFANFELRVPKIFDMGKSAKGFSTAFVELNMNGNPRANECSRQYVRLRENGEGFDVELLTGSGNTLGVDDATVTNKGECLFAKVGSTIKLQPDWYIQVIK